MNAYLQFLRELKRRSVFKVAVAYGVSAWLFVQVASIVIPAFELPGWSMRAVLIALAILGIGLYYVVVVLEKNASVDGINDAMQAAIAEHHPPSYRGNHVKINYVTQVREAPPVFVFFANHPEGIRTDYKRYLEGKLRDAFGFEGVPLTLAFKEK